MGNGNAEENAQDRQAAFKSALTGKHLPVLCLLYTSDAADD